MGVLVTRIHRPAYSRTYLLWTGYLDQSWKPEKADAAVCGSVQKPRLLLFTWGGINLAIVYHS